MSVTGLSSWLPYWNSTVAPKSVSNVTSLEPLICPWEALSFQNCHILPKRNIHLRSHNTLPKWNILSVWIRLNSKEADTMATHIPPDMIPRMDWNAEDKQAAWAFYRERLEQYFVIAGTPNEAKVTHILFYGGKEASEWWTALKDQVEGNKDEADTVFKAFANSFEKSSSHWQARDEYLSDIKQTKNQTTAELDIYIKDLIRRCQFPPEDQESRRMDLLYHATAHFEVRKFVHNAKQEELKYDRMIEVAKPHERTCQEYQIHKQAHSMANPSNSYSNPLIQTNALSKSFQKGPPKKTCAKCGCSHSHGDCPAHRTTCGKCGHLNHWAQQCRSSGRRNSSTGHSPSPGRPQNTDASAATGQTKAGDEEAMASRNLLPKGQAVAVAEEQASPSRRTP